MRVIFLYLFLGIGVCAHAQITAQGQGGKLVFWNALALEQSIGERFVNKNTIAYSRKSTMESWNPFRLPGIFTVREELEYKISRRFKTATGIFYAQHFYDDASHPDFINEIRIYPKIYHQFKLNRIGFSQYFRTDFRFFFSPGFHRWHKPFEFRTRYLMKMLVPLDKKERNYMVFITEFLAATDENVADNGRKTFTRFRFTENRSSVFFRHHIPNPNMFLDIGIMNQMWREGVEKRFNQTLLLQVDWVFIDLLGKKKKR